MARKLDDWIKAYMKYSSYSEAPDKFHFWSAISTIAGALQRKVWIECGYWQWVPNFYIIFVAPPGIVAKSTTSSIGMNLLKQVPKIKFGPDACTWQVLIQELAKSKSTFMTPDGKILRQSAMTISASELGTFLDPRNGEMVDALVSLWDGQKGTWKKATKTQGSDEIENPWINLLGCTTPAWISGAFPDYMVGGGFTSRTVFVYADTKRQLVAYPHLVASKTNKQQHLEESLIHDLIEINKMVGEYKLTEEAVALGEIWYRDFFTNKPAHLDTDQFEGYIARKQTHIHKIAMVLAASESDDLRIHDGHLERAIAITTGIEADMPKVFGRIGSNQHSKHQALIKRLLKTHGAIWQTELYAMVYKNITPRDFEETIKGLVKAGLVTLMADKGKVKIIPNETLVQSRRAPPPGPGMSGTQPTQQPDPQGQAEPPASSSSGGESSSG